MYFAGSWEEEEEGAELPPPLTGEANNALAVGAGADGTGTPRSVSMRSSGSSSSAAAFLLLLASPPRLPPRRRVGGVKMGMFLKGCGFLTGVAGWAEEEVSAFWSSSAFATGGGAAAADE